MRKSRQILLVVSMILALPSLPQVNPGASKMLRLHSALVIVEAAARPDEKVRTGPVPGP